MGSIHLPESVHDQIRLLASVWNIAEPAVVERLLDDLKTKREPAGEAPQPRRLAVYGVYGGQRIEGTFDPTTEHMKIISGPMAGREFRSPSGAARAVVIETNPTVHPNCNGWDFWTVAATGRTLQSVRTQRAGG